MAGVFKEIGTKDVHWLAAGVVAIGLWILLWTMPFQISGNAIVSTQLMLTTAAVSATLWGLNGLIKLGLAARQQHQALKKRRKIIRELTQACKDVLWAYLIVRRRSQNFNSSSCDHLCDIGVLEYANLGLDRRISDDYWDLLEEEGWTLLYEGREKPSNEPPAEVER